MHYYDPLEGTKVRNRMRSFLRDRIEEKKAEIARYFLSSSFNKEARLELDVGVKGKISEARDFSKLSLETMGYVGFQEILKRVDISDKFVQEFTREVSFASRVLRGYDRKHAAAIVQGFLGETRVVFSKTELGRLQAQKTAWSQYSSLLDFFIAVAARETGHDFSQEVGGIRSFVNESLSAIDDKTQKMYPREHSSFNALEHYEFL